MSSPQLEDALRWSAVLGPITAAALAQRTGTSQASAEGRLGAAVGARLMCRWRPLHQRPSLFTPSRAGLAVIHQSGPVQRPVAAATAEHALACATVAVGIERSYGGWQLGGPPELRRRETRAGRPLAGARSLSPGHAGGRRHRPDLVLWPAEGSLALPIAVEVELTVKAPARLLEICRSWVRSREVGGVLYVVAPGVRAPLERAIEGAGAERVISLLEIAPLLASGDAVTRHA